MGDKKSWSKLSDVLCQDGWVIGTISDFGKNGHKSVVNGPFGSDLLTSELQDSGTPVIYSGDVREGRYVRKKKSKTFVTGEKAASLSAFRVNCGDVIVAKVGDPPGTAAVYRGKMDAIVTQDVIRLSLSPQHESGFLSEILNSDIGKRQVNRIKISGTRARVSLTDFKKMKVPHAPLAEQKKIAEILSTWDRAIEVAEAQLDCARTQKRALMQHLLTGRRRFPEFERQEWKEVRLGEIVECLDNKRVPLNSSQRAEMKGTIPYWGANGIVDYVNDYIFDEPIVLLAEDGGYFDEFATRPIASVSYGKAWVNNHAHILRANSNVNTEWLFYSLVHKNILGFINSGTRSKLNKSDMLKIPMVLPTLEEQYRMAEVIGIADTETKDLEVQATKLRTEKKALMQQLLTGKRRVSV